MNIVLVDERISPTCERSLLIRGFSPIKLPPDRDLGEAVRSHPDTLLFADGRNIITTADYCDTASYIFSDLREQADDLIICFTSDRRGKEYPQDCVMNALVIDDMLFCKTDSVSKAILDYAKKNDLRVIHTKQGYPACTVLSFGRFAITADQGMVQVLKNNGIETLLIGPGHIALPPHEYGFIGGASFVHEKKVYFFGDINLHPYSSAILDFIYRHGYEAISLSEEGLLDLGGAVVL